MFHTEAARRGPKPPGQLRTRVEELRNPWRQGSPFTLSHNESARMATDALLEHGEDAYLKVLEDEKELPFLSILDIDYVCSNADASNKDTLQSAASVELPEEDCLSQQTSGTYFPLNSDFDAPMLELGWPEVPPTTKLSQTEVQVIFQRQRSNCIKDLLRSLISQAKHVIAIVMDLFTDVDILCDLVAAASKRKIPVYLLLDEKNLIYFIEMWDKLNFKSIQCPNLKVRTVTGSTYCTKSGKKFSGQFLEKFLLIDCEQVVTGTYSFSWLSSQVHSNMVTHFKGRIVQEFDTEFRCLYADSTVAEYFYNSDDLTNSYPRPIVWNAQPARRSVKLSEPDVSNNSSTISSTSASSLKASPYATSTIFNVIHENKELPSEFTDQGRKEAIGGLKVNFNNQDRRQSDPHTGNSPYADYGLGLYSRHNLLSGRTSALSRSTPALNIFEPVPNFAQLTTAEHNGYGQKKSGNSFNHAAHVNYTVGEKNTHFDSGRHNDTSIEQGGNLSRNDKRMTLGHSHLHMMMNYRPNQVTGTQGLQREHVASARRKSDVSYNQAENATPSGHRKGSWADPISAKGISNEHNSIMNNDENTMTLGHSRLDMITNFKPHSSNSPQPEHNGSTVANGDQTLNQIANGNQREYKKNASADPVGLKEMSKEQSSNLNRDENTMTLGHSKLDLITKFRPQSGNSLQPENTTSTSVNSDRSLNQSANANQTESKKDACQKPVGLKAGLKDQSSKMNSDENTMTLGHSKLDLMLKSRPQQSTGPKGIQPEHKTSAMVKKDILCNGTAAGSYTESEKDECIAPLRIKDSSSVSRPLTKSDKRMTLGHSKLDMITNHTRAKANQVYSRFNH